MTSSKLLTEQPFVKVFRRYAFWTVMTVYLLILVGGIVRSTGAGMGCPDWPRCFGSWVPPTEVSQLPENYKEIYGAALKGEVEFNVVKTWTEYVNRLFGVFTGLLIFATLLASIPFLKTNYRSFFYLSLSAFILVGFQGWLGSKVVSSELHPVMITLHMLLAIVIVFILIYALARSYGSVYRPESLSSQGLINCTLLITIFISTLQVMIGTQVREAMDIIIDSLGYHQREKWIGELGTIFYVHRTFSIVILLANGFLAYLIYKYADRNGALVKLVLGVMTVVVLEALTGVVIVYFGVPAFSQPIHLTLAIVMLGLQFVLYMFVNASRFMSFGKGEMDTLVTLGK